MATVVWWIFILAVLAALAAAGAISAKAYRDGTSPSAVFFKPKSEPRIEVVEHTSLDGKRKLILIRRDGVEHLIMTGGPVDVVIETGIGEPPKRAAEPAVKPAASVFTRPPRAFGTVTPPMTPASSAAVAAAEDEADLALKR
jgi:flagellar protein FliO/FliZ